MGWIMFDHVLLTSTYTLQKPSCYVRQQSVWLLQLCDYLYYARFMNAVLNKKNSVGADKLYCHRMFCKLFELAWEG